MNRWIVEFSPSADRSFCKLSRDIQARLTSALRRYAETGAGNVIHLSGRPGEFRLRTGDYRVVFERHGERLVILVLHVGHRRDVYKD